jgi:hypothetical protein
MAPFRQAQGPEHVEGQRGPMTIRKPAIRFVASNLCEIYFLSRIAHFAAD